MICKILGPYIKDENLHYENYWFRPCFDGTYSVIPINGGGEYLISAIWKKQGKGKYFYIPNLDVIIGNKNCDNSKLEFDDLTEAQNNLDKKLIEYGYHLCDEEEFNKYKLLL